jgi:hypothetical protein
MKRGGHSTSNGILVVSLVVIYLTYTCGQSQLQCPSGLVTVFPNGTADFGSLPAGAEDVDPVYDPGPIGGWYSLARGFVDVVRPGSLPYGMYVCLVCIADGLALRSS